MHYIQVLVGRLMDMGFPRAKVEEALIACGGDPDEAASRLMSQVGLCLVGLPYSFLIEYPFLQVSIDFIRRVAQPAACCSVSRYLVSEAVRFRGSHAISD